MALVGNHGIVIPRDKALLSYFYWQQEMGLPQMAVLFGVTHKSIERVMRELNIPRRGKGKSRHTKCVEVGCGQPVYKIRHKTNGSFYGKHCREHRQKHRNRLQRRYINRPDVRISRNDQCARWYYKGPLTIEGDKQWIQHARRLLRAAKRLSVDPKLTPEVCLSLKRESRQGRILQT